MAQPTFAGVWTDQKSDGAMVFMFTGDDLGTIESEVQTRIAPGLPFRVVRAERSWADLLALQDRIENQREELRSIGVDIVETAVDTGRNSVLIGVANEDDRSRALLGERFGAGVYTRPDQASSADTCTIANCPPIKGGLRITGAGGVFCTSGFLARRADVGAQLVVVTAGHCIEATGGTGGLWKHPSTAAAFGASQKETFAANSNADAGIIGVYSGSVPSADRNAFWAGYAVRFMGSWSYTFEQHQGDGVCRTGAKTGGQTCGNIRFVNVNRPSCIGALCYTIHNQIEVDFDSLAGDSGGSVYFASRGMGLHTHSEDETNPALAPFYGWYTPLDWARDTYSAMWGVSFYYCVTSLC